MAQEDILPVGYYISWYYVAESKNLGTGLQMRALVTNDSISMIN
jgi:hypothetical protein